MKNILVVITTAFVPTGGADYSDDELLPHDE